MQKWEYCEVWWTGSSALGGLWNTINIELNVFSIRGISQQKIPGKEWPTLFARLGADGWELVSTMPSPTNVQQYWYYFKRPIS